AAADRARRWLPALPDRAVVAPAPAWRPQARREARRHFARDPELLVLLLADPSRAVVHGDADAPLVGGIGAAAVPEASVPDEHASGRHLRRHAVVRRAVLGVVAQVGSRDHAGGAVRLP